jgi:broad specificity phosphatase PhoE
MIIYLTRHGQTTGDIENRYGGDYDDHLTDVGKQQSAKLAELLAGKEIERLYTSPRIRAKETSAFIAERLGLAAQTLDDFRERNGYGILTGMTKEEALHKHPDQVELLNDVHNKVEDAEEYVPFQKRITAALRTVSKEPVRKIAIVTHGGPIRLIFRDILKLGEIDIGDCAFVILEANNQGYTLLEKKGIEIKH